MDAVLLDPLSPLPSPSSLPSSPCWLPFQWGSHKNGKQGFQREKERGGGRGEGRCSPTISNAPSLHPSAPNSLLAFHTPGSAIQARSCMYMSLSTNNTSLWFSLSHCDCTKFHHIQILPAERVLQKLKSKKKKMDILIILFNSQQTEKVLEVPQKISLPVSSVRLNN